MLTTPESDHRAALKEIARLMEDDPARGTPKGDRLEALASLVEAYERAMLSVDSGDH